MIEEEFIKILREHYYSKNKIHIVLEKIVFSFVMKNMDIIDYLNIRWGSVKYNEFYIYYHNFQSKHYSLHDLEKVLNKHKKICNFI